MHHGLGHHRLIKELGCSSKEQVVERISGGYDATREMIRERMEGYIEQFINDCRNIF